MPGGGLDLQQQTVAKLVLLGEMGSGKSSLVLRYVKGQFFDFQARTFARRALALGLAARGVALAPSWLPSITATPPRTAAAARQRPRELVPCGLRGYAVARCGWLASRERDNPALLLPAHPRSSRRPRRWGQPS